MSRNTMTASTKLTSCRTMLPATNLTLDSIDLMSCARLSTRSRETWPKAHPSRSRLACNALTLFVGMCSLLSRLPRRDHHGVRRVVDVQQHDETVLAGQRCRG